MKTVVHLAAAVFAVGGCLLPDECLLMSACAQDDAQRTRSGLLLLYDFSSTDGPIIKDRSGVGEAVDLRIENMDSVRRSKGSVEVRGKTLIRSDKPPRKLLEAIRA